MKVVFASYNQGKCDGYKDTFKKLGIELVSLNEIGCCEKVEETGDNTLENAVIKAEFYHKLLGLPVLSNDSGLIVSRFSKENQPGVFVRRYNGKEMTDEELISTYEELFECVGGESEGVFSVSLAALNEKGKLFKREFHYSTFFKCPASKARVKGLPFRSFEYDRKLKKHYAEFTDEDWANAHDNTKSSDDIDEQADFIRSAFKN